LEFVILRSKELCRCFPRRPEARLSSDAKKEFRSSDGLPWVGRAVGDYVAARQAKRAAKNKVRFDLLLLLCFSSLPDLFPPSHIAATTSDASSRPALPRSRGFEHV
jgi:hypothetical protein